MIWSRPRKPCETSRLSSANFAAWGISPVEHESRVKRSISVPLMFVPFEISDVRLEIPGE